MTFKHRFLYFFLIAAIILGISAGQTPPVKADVDSAWISLGPQGGSIPALVVDPQSPSTIYAGTASGVFRSTNGGSTWSFSGVGSLWVYALAIDPLTHTTVYAGTRGEGVYKSLDSGATWFKANTGIEDQVVYSLAINPLNPNTLYIGSRSITSGKSAALDEWDPAAYPAMQSPDMDDSEEGTTEWGGGVFRSLDGGLHWTRQNNGLIEDWAYSVAIDPANTAIIYAGLHTQGVFKSWDYGNTWIKTGPGLNNSKVRSIAIDPINSWNVLVATWHGGIFQSTDGGNNWGNNTLPTTKVRYLAFGRYEVYAGLWGGGVYKSINRGGSFSVVNNGLINFYVNALAIDPYNYKNVYGGFDGGAVYKTSSAGASWFPSGAGLNVTRVKSVVVDPVSPTIFYAGTQGDGIFKSLDRGLSWTQLNWGLGSLYVNALVVDPYSHQTVYAATDAGIYRTTDGGARWVLRSRGMGEISVISLSLFPWSPPVIYAGTLGNDVWISTNGSDTWYIVPLNPEDPTLQVNSILVDPRTASVVYAGTQQQGLIKSLDFGTHWSVMDAGMGRPAIETIAFEPGQPDILYTGTSYGLYKSISGGQSWYSLNLGTDQVNAIWVDAAVPGTVYAGLNGGGVYMQAGEGGYWQSMNTNLTNRFITWLVMAPGDPSNLYAATAGGGAYRLSVNPAQLLQRVYLPVIIAVDNG